MKRSFFLLRKPLMASSIHLGEMKMETKYSDCLGDPVYMHHPETALDTPPIQNSNSPNVSPGLFLAKEQRGSES